MKTNKLVIAVAMLLYLAAAANIAFSTPVAPQSVQVQNTYRRTDFGGPAGANLSAQAGNVTEIIIDSTVRTNRWQGFFGNITGSITLDDANNYTFYSWDEIVNPKGEVYASNTSVTDWTKVECINLSSALKGFNCTGENETCLNITKIESFFGMGSSDADGIDETFNSTNGIVVGDLTLTLCPATKVYANDSTQEVYWNQTLLTINDTETIIFATQLEDDEYGYNQEQWDFQLLVAENGDDSAVTTYFIYTEIV